jgi:branched-chain amino acid transport system ATP-binding protein
MTRRTGSTADRPLLHLDDVHAYYGDHHVLDGISFGVDRDEVVAYLGRNGTGKTTTFKLVTGLLEPREGTITYDGDVINGLAPHVVGRRGVAYVAADRKVFPHLTVRENIRLPTLERDAEPDYESLFELFPDLREYDRSRAGSLSGGQQQMVAIAQALASDPDLLLLDEPVQGLAVQFVEKVSDLLGRLTTERDLAVLLIEHDIDLVFEVADRVLVLDEGRIVWEGTSAELEANDEVVDRYIGVRGYA